MGQLIVLDGCTFFICDETGDTNSNPNEGFYNEDVRIFAVGAPRGRQADRRPDEQAVDYYSARIVGGRATTSRSRSGATAS